MKSPILLYLVPFVGGLLLQEYCPLPWLWPVLVLASLCLSLAWVCRHKGRFSLCFLFLAVLSIGYSVAVVRQPDFRNDHYLNRLSRSQEDRCWMTVRLAETPRVSSRTLSAGAEVKAIRIGDDDYASTGKVQLFFQKSAKSDLLKRGDVLLIWSDLCLPSGRENPYQFDYRGHLRHKGVLRQCYLDDVGYCLVDHRSAGVMEWVETLRHRLLGVIRCSNLTMEQQSIAEALVLGWREDIDPETQRQYRDAGITHLLCVSGLHVGVVALLIGGCLFFLGNSPKGKKWRGVLQLFGVWIFVLFSGMAPSTLRAAIMFSFVIVGQMFFVRPPTLNAVASSALLLLIVRPGLLFDVGFELSYSAVFGIVTLQRPVCSLLPLPRRADMKGKSRLARASVLFGRKVWEWTVLTTVAQLSTLPFSLYYFHQFSVYFLVANLTIVPFAGFLLGSVLLMMLVFWWPWFFGFCSTIVSWELNWMDAVTRWVGTLPHAVVADIYWDGPMALMLVVGIVLLGWALVGRSVRRLVAGLGVLVLFAGHVCGCSISMAHQRAWVVYSFKKGTAMEIFVGNESLLLGDSAVAADVSTIDYQRKNLVTRRKIDKTAVFPVEGTSLTMVDGDVLLRDHYLRLGSTNLLLMDRQNGMGLRYLVNRQEEVELPKFPVPLDYLVLTETPLTSVSEMQQFYQFDTLVVAADNGWRWRERWLRECDSLHVPVIDLASHGGLCRRFR